MVNSRNKGASFERQIAAELHQMLGLKFQRDLEQYRHTDHGDLICEDKDWPFLLELKRYADGQFKQAWWDQADRAAKLSGLWPVVIYKFDRLPIRVRMSLDVISCCIGGGPIVLDLDNDYLADISLDGFCYLAREAMAGRKYD
jgi:hypothetical protein